MKTELEHACVLIYLIFFFKAKSSGEETCVIYICFYIWYASSLDKTIKTVIKGNDDNWIN